MNQNERLSFQLLPGMPTPLRTDEHSQGLQIFLNRLNSVRMTTAGYMAQCPSHEDHTPSLSIATEKDRILVHCFAGCCTEDILAAMGLDFPDLFLNEAGTNYSYSFAPKSLNKQQTSDSSMPLPTSSGKRRKSQESVTAVYEFHDSKGSVVATKTRFDWIEEDENGQVRNRKRFVVEPSGLSLPLYNLPAIESAIRQHWPVYLAEGEQKADILNDYFRYQWGMSAVATSYGGHWRKELAYTLSDATCIIVPDRDDAGRKHAVRIMNDLHGIASSISVANTSSLLATLEVGECGQ